MNYVQNINWLQKILCALSVTNTIIKKINTSVEDGKKETFLYNQFKGLLET